MATVTKRVYLKSQGELTMIFFYVAKIASYRIIRTLLKRTASVLYIYLNFKIITYAVKVSYNLNQEEIDQ